MVTLNAFYTYVILLLQSVGKQQLQLLLNSVSCYLHINLKVPQFVPHVPHSCSCPIDLNHSSSCLIDLTHISPTADFAP